VEEVPIKAIDILLVIVARKLKKRVDEIPLSKSIKDLVGGKSTLQNEILGDLQQEFASAPEKGEALPLEELVQCCEAGFSGTPVNTVQALFLVSLEAKCLVVSIRRPSRIISARAGD